MKGMTETVARRVIEKSAQRRSRGQSMPPELIELEEASNAFLLELENNRSFYQTQAWRELRYQTLKIQGRRCACCGATPSDGRQVHVDHIKPRSTHPELELDPNNLQILCEMCNLGKGNSDSIDWRKEP